MSDSNTENGGSGAGLSTSPSKALFGKFCICGGKGFHIRFDNGWTVSVQFGPGNYCDNYDMQIGRDDKKAGEQGSRNAECALIDPEGNLIHRNEWGDSVSSRSTPADVLALLNEAASKPNVSALPPQRSGGRQEQVVGHSEIVGGLE